MLMLSSELSGVQELRHSIGVRDELSEGVQLKGSTSSSSVAKTLAKPRQNETPIMDACWQLACVDI